MRYAYPCVLTPDPDGGFVVSFPDVRGALTGGDDVADATEQARDALAVALAGYIREGWDIPEPSPLSDHRPGRKSGKTRVISVPVLPIVAAKIALNRAMTETGMSNVKLAEKLGISETAVRRLVDPDHRSRIDSVLKALDSLGRTLVIEDRAA
jgi:antitoxin HicB